MEPIKQIDLDGCVLVDEDGAESALKVEGVEIIPQDILDHEVAMEATRVTFVASAIPPVGYKIYHLQKRAMTNPTEDCIIQGLGALENTYYRVSVQAEGTLEITDKESGEVYAGLGYFEDSGDRGDEYNYDPPENQFILDTRGKVAEVSLLEDEKDWGTIGVRMGWELPAEVSPDRRSRSVKKIPCEIVMEVSLQRGVKRVDLRAEVDNRARDHRLRVSFPTGIRTTQSIAQSAFDVVRRPVDLPGGTDWAELPSPTHPTSGFVAIEGEGRGLAVFGKGLREYEVTPEGQIYLTLLRSVGWLSRGDLKSRPGNAGPPYETPGAQCMGRQVFEYAVMPYQGGWLDAGVHHEVQRFNLPPLASEVKDGDPGQRTVTFLEVEPGEILISALKLSEEHDGLTLRLCNLSETQMEGSIRIGFAASKAFSMDLNESDLVPLPLEEGTLPLQFRAKEIKTVLLVP
jgi:alpha-mannosidase